MNTKRSEYYELDVDEIYKLYRGRFQLTKVIFCVLLIGWLWLYLQDKVETLLFVLVYTAVFFVYLMYYSTYFWRAENKIFFTDCAPIKMFQFIEKLELKDKKGKSKNTLLLEKARCCFSIKDREEEAWTYLQQIDFSKKNYNNELARLLLCSNYHLYKQDKVAFNDVKNQILNLHTIYPTKGNDNNIVKVRKLLDLKECMMVKEYEPAREILNRLLSEKNVMVDKVLYIFHLAVVDVAEGKFDDARARLHYVIDNGNELKQVIMAKEMLEEIEGREHE